MLKELDKRALASINNRLAVFSMPHEICDLRSMLVFVTSELVAVQTTCMYGTENRSHGQRRGERNELAPRKKDSKILKSL